MTELPKAGIVISLFCRRRQPRTLHQRTAAVQSSNQEDVVSLGSIQVVDPHKDIPIITLKMCVPTFPTYLSFHALPRQGKSPAPNRFRQLRYGKVGTEYLSAVMYPCKLLTSLA